MHIYHTISLSLIPLAISSLAGSSLKSAGASPIWIECLTEKREWSAFPAPMAIDISMSERKPASPGSMESAVPTVNPGRSACMMFHLDSHQLPHNGITNWTHHGTCIAVISQVKEVHDTPYIGPLTNIITWVQCFAWYLASIVWKFLESMPDLSHVMMVLQFYAHKH